MRELLKKIVGKSEQPKVVKHCTDLVGRSMEPGEEFEEDLGRRVFAIRLVSTKDYRN